MSAYYNEHDRNAAAWLRELIKAGLIAPGDVDERSIEDVTPNDIAGYTQCHFFAGIGVWSYALRQAGWPDDRPVWTGSCPCQPFSAAGKGGGFDDERHLWPAFHYLITQCRPVTVFGEQVASKDGLAWLDLVQADLEGTGYAVGAVDTCAAGFGAPHIRQRLYWVADDGSSRLEGWQEQSAREECQAAQRGDHAGGMVNHDRDSGPTVATNGFWGDADWLFCRDNKWRSVESGTFPLVDGTPARVGRSGDFVTPEYSAQTTEARIARLRGYGNAIVAPVAVAFIQSYLEVVNGKVL